MKRTKQSLVKPGRFSAYTSDLSGAATPVASTINAEASLLALSDSLAAATSALITAGTHSAGDVIISRANTQITTAAVAATPATTGVSLSTNTNAENAISKIDTAIKFLKTQRSELGAVSNRLSHTVDNLTNISVNQSAAQGAIEDAGFARETTQLAKNQILQQFYTAMLAQANVAKQQVLSVLQG